ncbi:MAG: translation initiation factor IF-2 [Spirochaetaceae bacterium]|nr:MAG: translation initiation factor IF-2 [Spirochaetaceae bacterium]
MAEEKEKETKPKATLIKHRKDEPKAAPAAEEDKTEKKKVRVVVKRRGKSKSPDSGQVPARPADAEPEAGQKSRPKSAPAASKQESDSGVEKSAERPETAAGKPASSGEEAKRSAEPAQPRNRFRVEGGPEPPPSVRERKIGQPHAPQQRKSEKPEAPERGRPASGPPRPAGPGGRPGGGPGPGRPAARPMGRPGGAPGAARPPRPGAPPGEAPAQSEKRPSGKKFFKTKRKPYPSKDRHQEKSLQYKPKKSTPKANPVPKSIDIMEVVTVSELARKMNLKASDLIGKLMSMGMMVTINQQIDAETAQILAGEYGCEVNIVSLYDETIIATEDDEAGDVQPPRPPIVTVMGHVDHGKTKLLDAIRTTDVVAGEFGGITQHIGAYQIELPQQGKVTFLDTPGHEAFTLMRARGAQVTDIVILVVAADDGVMPQTREAVDHAKAAGVPIIVAINKIDLPAANPDRVKQQLSDLGLMPEAWGGSTLYCEVSALKKEGIPQLLETVLLQSEVLELRANQDCNAEGKVVESRIDPGRGTVSTVLILRGTLRVGDSFVAGVYPGRVRAMFNDRGDKVDEAYPSMPVEILGFTGIPNAGDPFQVTGTEKLARQVGDKRQELRKVEVAKNVKKITLDNLYDSIQEGGVQELRVIIKGDVHGSVEALQSALEKLSTSEIRLNVLHSAAGAINENDVMLAAASEAIVIGFNVRPTARAQELADQEKVEIRKYNIIYDVVNEVRSAMEGLLAPDLKEETIGTVEVRELFKVPKLGVIAGSYVTSGKIRRNAQVHVIRDGVRIYSGKVVSLRRFKDDAREVDQGYECGVGVENFSDLKVGDVLEVYEVKEVAKKLHEAT